MPDVQLEPSAAPAGAPDAAAAAVTATAVLSGLDKPGMGEDVLPGVKARHWEAREARAVASRQAEQPAQAPATDPGTAAAAAAASAVGTHGGEAAAPVAAPAKFTFAGVDFEDQAKAEHSFKTLRGMHAAKDKTIATVQSELLEARKELLRLQKSQGREDQPTVTPNGQAAAAPTKEVSAEDTYAVFEVLKEKFGPKFAQGWLDEQNEARVQSRVEKLIEERFAKLQERIKPYEESSAQIAEQRQLSAVFTQLASYKLPDGSPAYPEFEDASVMRDVGVLWKNLGFDLDSMKSPRGVHLAIVAYRDAMATRARAATPKTPRPAAPAVADPVVSAGGDSAGKHPQQVTAPETLGDRLLRAEVGPDKALGFRIRKF